MEPQTHRQQISPLLHQGKECIGLADVAAMVKSFLNAAEDVIQAQQHSVRRQAGGILHSLGPRHHCSPLSTPVSTSHPPPPSPHTLHLPPSHPLPPPPLTPSPSGVAAGGAVWSPASGRPGPSLEAAAGHVTCAPDGEGTKLPRTPPACGWRAQPAGSGCGMGWG